MKLNKSKNIRHAVLISPETLQFFVAFINDNYNKIRYEGTCNDGSIIDFNSYDELIEYENASFKRIESLNIYATNSERDNLGKIFFEFQISFGSYSSPVRYKIESEDYNRTIAFERDLELRIKDFKPWYSWLTGVNFIIAGFIFLCASFFILLGIGTIMELNGKLEISDTDSEHILLAPALTYFGIGCLIGTGYLLNKFNRYFFPKVFISLGRQQTTRLNKHNVLYFIFVLIGLGIIIGVIANIISSLVTK